MRSWSLDFLNHAHYYTINTVIFKSTNIIYTYVNMLEKSDDVNFYLNFFSRISNTSLKTLVFSSWFMILYLLHCLYFFTSAYRKKAQLTFATWSTSKSWKYSYIHSWLKAKWLSGTYTFQTSKVHDFAMTFHDVTLKFPWPFLAAKPWLCGYKSCIRLSYNGVFSPYP